MTFHAVSLGDLITLKRGYDLPSNDRKDGAVPIVSSSGVTGSHSEAKVKGPGVVTGRYGTLGEVFYVEEDFWPLNTALYVQNFKGNNPRFISYFLRKELMGLLSDKAAVPGVNRNDLHARKILTVTDHAVQGKIADVLTRYDNLIANNSRRIGLLEQSARLLFQEWFVYLRYPGHAHDKIIEDVPQSWKRTFVPDIIDINPKVSVSKGKEIWYVPMSSVSETGMTLNPRYFERRTKHTNVKFMNGDILFARITPCLENGKTGYVDFLSNGEMACGSTEFIVLRGRRVSSEFTYCLARMEPFRGKAIKSMTGSSGRQRVNDSCFDDYVVALPPDSLLSMFDEVANAYFEQARLLFQQNQTLIRARDLLLPRLMDGRIAV